MTDIPPASPDTGDAAAPAPATQPATVPPGGADPGRAARRRAPRDPDDVRPLRVNTPRVVLAGTALWGIALVVTLLVPPLHSGGNDWWPQACAVGVVLGAIGYAYVRRGRGNAAAA